MKTEKKDAENSNLTLMLPFIHCSGSSSSSSNSSSGSSRTKKRRERYTNTQNKKKQRMKTDKKKIADYWPFLALFQGKELCFVLCGK